MSELSRSIRVNQLKWRSVAGGLKRESCSTLRKKLKVSWIDGIGKLREVPGRVSVCDKRWTDHQVAMRAWEQADFRNRYRYKINGLQR